MPIPRGNTYMWLHIHDFEATISQRYQLETSRESGVWGGSTTGCRNGLSNPRKIRINAGTLLYVYMFVSERNVQFQFQMLTINWWLLDDILPLKTTHSILNKSVSAVYDSGTHGVNTLRMKQTCLFIHWHFVGIWLNIAVLQIPLTISL